MKKYILLSLLIMSTGSSLFSAVAAPAPQAQNKPIHINTKDIIDTAIKAIAIDQSNSLNHAVTQYLLGYLGVAANGNIPKYDKIIEKINNETVNYDQSIKAINALVEVIIYVYAQDAYLCHNQKLITIGIQHPLRYFSNTQKMNDCIKLLQELSPLLWKNDTWKLQATRHYATVGYYSLWRKAAFCCLAYLFVDLYKNNDVSCIKQPGIYAKIKMFTSNHYQHGKDGYEWLSKYINFNKMAPAKDSALRPSNYNWNPINWLPSWNSISSASNAGTNNS